jgi:hypothetical protein
MPSSFKPQVLDVPSGLGDPAAGSEVKRALRSAAIALARYQIRNLRRVFEEFEHDILLPILLGEIAMRNLGELENFPSAKSDDDGVFNPCAAETPLKPCNAYSIAAATGLPRETVRRKIARLVELDWVCRKDNGHLYLSFNALQHYGNVLSSRDLDDVLDTADRVRRALEQVKAAK